MALKIVRRHDEVHDEMERLREREALKTDMIRIAAHGLMNPLSLVTGFAEMLSTEMGELTADQRVCVDGIQTAAVRMQHIVETVLSLERLEELDGVAINELIELAGLVRGVLEFTQQDARGLGVQVQTDLQDVRVRGDFVQLYQTLANIIGNAIKYSGENGQVTVSVEKKDNVARITVTDNGIGIPEKDQRRIFDPFYRAGNVFGKGMEGVGLGLYLCRRVVERHHGRILMDSREGEGTTFTIELPLA